MQLRECLVVQRSMQIEVEVEVECRTQLPTQSLTQRTTQSAMLWSVLSDEQREVL